VQWNVLGNNMTKFFFNYAKERTTITTFMSVNLVRAYGSWI